MGDSKIEPVDKAAVIKDEARDQGTPDAGTMPSRWSRLVLSLVLGALIATPVGEHPGRNVILMATGLGVLLIERLRMGAKGHKAVPTEFSRFEVIGLVAFCLAMFGVSTVLHDRFEYSWGPPLAGATVSLIVLVVSFRSTGRAERR